MSVTLPGLLDDLSELDTPDRPSRSESRFGRRVPANSEAMARPWRLGIVGLGVGLGVVARLLAANGVFSVLAETMVYAAAVTSALVGVGLLMLAAERDRFGRWMVLLAAMVGLSMASLQWISPHFVQDTVQWDDAAQVALALLGLGDGLLLAGMLTLAFVRRHPTMTVVAILAAGFLTLMTGTVLLRNEWPSIGALSLAFGCVLLAWDRAPRHEPKYVALEDSPRISRAALSLATVAIGGAVIQLWVSRGEEVGRSLAAVGVSVVLVAGAFMALVRIRREIQRRETTLSEWTSWMREFRTGEFRSEFENLATNEGGRAIGDVTGESPISFRDLPVDDGSLFAGAASTKTRSEAGGFAAAVAPPPSAFEVLWAKDADERAADPLWPPAPSDDQRSLFDEPARPEATRPASVASEDPPHTDEAMPRVIEAPAEVEEIEPEVELPDDVPEVAPPAIRVEPPETARKGAPEIAEELPVGLVTPVGPVTPKSTPIVVNLAAAREEAAREEAARAEMEPTAPQPTEQSSGIPAVTPGADAPHAPAIAIPDLSTPDEATGIAQPPSADGAFSSWLGGAPSEPSSTEPAAADPGPEQQTPARPSTATSIASLQQWLGEPAADGAERLIIAIETMSLADFDELPAEVSEASNQAMLAALGEFTPAPNVATEIDGPYLMAAWDHADSGRLRELNREVLALLATPVDTPLGAVALTGTLALLRPQPRQDLDAVIGTAIEGLLQARRLQSTRG
ncbi:MAG: hypothetical protein AAF567_14335 [Actinomycetota bacterium]